MSRNIDRYDDGESFSYVSRSAKRGKFVGSSAPIGVRDHLRRKRRHSYGNINQRRNKHWAW